MLVHAEQMNDRLVAWMRAHRTSLLRTLWLLLATFALYLLAANAFLNSALGERTINRRPERFSARWSWAISAYPGHIHARGLDLGGRARPMAWRATAASADGRIALLPLLRRELRFAHIDARDVAVVTDRGRRDRSPPPAPRAATGGTPWTLRFDAIRTDTLVRLQFDEWRIEGGGRARFGMARRLRGGPLEVLPSMLRMPAATIRKGGHAVLRDARIALDFALPRHRPAALRGKRKLAIADARLALQGRVPGIAVTEAADGRLAWAFDGSAGTLDVRLRLQDGALQPGGRVRLLAPLQVAGRADSGVHRYRLRIEADVDAQGLRLRAAMPPQGARPDRLQATLRSRHRRLDPLRWRALFDDLSGRVELSWRFGSLRWLNPLLSERRWLRLDGAALLDADLRLVDGTLVAGSLARVREATLRAEILDSVFLGNATADARVTGTDPRLQVAIVAPSFELVASAARGQAYVRGRDLRLDLDGDARLAGFRRTLAARLRFADARVPDLRAYNRYLPGNSLQLLGGSGRVSGDLRVDARGEVVRADVDVRGRRADVRFGVSRLVGDLSLQGRLRRIAAGARGYRIDRLAVALDGVRLAGASEEAWWARLDLDGARLDWRTPLGLDGDLRLRMRDAGLLLSLFAERSAFPRWIGNVVDDGEVRATARVRVAGDRLVLDDIRAGNDRVDLLARLQIDDGQPRGDLYARWGVLGVGAELEGGRRRLRTFGARAWYLSQPPLLPPR